MAHWPFIGRRSELERFTDALGDTRVDTVLVVGDAGVGKSRLALECLAAAEDRGHHVAHVTATASASAVPLSALAPLLPAEQDMADPHTLFEAARRRLRDRAQGRRFVLAIDDVDLLDTVSLALLSFLMADGTLFVVATQRREGAVPDALETRWRDGRAVRLTLDALHRQSVETLLHFALGGPATAGAVQWLWEASRGNVLFLRELVLSAQHEGALACPAGVWQLLRTPRGSSGLIELVQARLSGLSSAHRAVLELLALCEPLSVEELLAQHPAEVLTELEDEGLISVAWESRRTEVRLAHPLHSHTLQSSLPKLRARTILLRQADRVTGHGARRRGDPLLLASWRLDATGSADPELLLRAARLARFAHDLPRTERLASAALAHGAGAAAGLLLAESLHEQARFAEAEAALARAADGRSPGQELPVALSRAMNLLFGLGDPVAARAALDGAGVPAGDPAVAAVSALLANAVAGPVEAAGLLPPQPDGQRAEVRVLWHRAAAAVLADAGRVVEAAELAGAGFELHETVEDRTVVSHPATHLLTLADALLRQGAFDAAEQAAERGRQLVVDAGVEALICWFTGRLGAVALARGQVATAEARFAETLAQARGAGQRSALPMAMSGLIRARASRGPLPDGDPLLAELLEIAGYATWSAEPQRAIAWAEAAGGLVSQARSRLQEAAAEALRRGRANAATELWHDALRLGGDVAGPLGEACERVQGALAAVRAAHAAAVAAGDPGRLQEVAQRFAESGAHLLAAEAMTAAAELHRRQGSGRAAVGCSAAARRLAEGCQGARTPGLLGGGTLTPLTDREREIARLVVSGNSSRQIADLLFLSVRTVNNHLQNVYTKLGIGSRAELADVLAAEVTA
ncbi:LuxR family transcriptional regulator [Catellatospora sp. TT07R-123]|uniref:helix-turn-helix transcriptional regulator n=1 Tax=Catellatospora sp. TT07R-123 TaxID=2733863 RepID=UPI001BB36F93|nr:LuxR family transcriptional regulator [Catellatospora sp. TT07R-123]